MHGLLIINLYGIQYFMDKNNWLNHFKLYFICTLVAVFSQVVHAIAPIANDLKLSAIANLSKVALKNDQWLSVLPVIGDKNQYFIATEAGKVYQLNNNEIAQSAFFDLKLALENPSIIALTAITLDPNFSYRDRDGYHTFYTAHTEASQKTTSKLSPKNTKINLPFDAVIMRWQISSIRNTIPRLTQQHEVMRIAISGQQENIQQLSFNPYLAPWHNDFGLLFIALARSDTLKNEALYDGAILRIKPEKKGLNSYTIPADNPFTNTTDIHNEIIFIAGQNTEHFDWIKNSAPSLLVQFNQPDANVLITANIGDDWRKAIPQAQIKKHLPAVSTQRKTLLYHGREQENLRGKALHLREIENNWQLQTIVLPSILSSEDKSQDVRHKLIKPNANEPTKFSLHQSHNGELLLLEHNQQRLYTIKVPEIISSKTTITDNALSTSNNNGAFTLMFLLSLIVAGYFWYSKKNSVKEQSYLHEQWAKFELDKTKKSLSLYKRHAKTAELSLNLSTITRSEVLLNDEVISTISADSTPTFSNDLEDQVLTVFAKEHRFKMVNEKQRSIQLCLTDDQQNRYLFCLYFRVDDTRHTKLKYNKVIDNVIDWQWLFARHINPDKTTKRTIKVKIPREKPTNSVAISSTPAQELRAKIFEDDSTPAKHSLDISLDSSAEDDPVMNTNSQNSEAEASNIDTKLVFALDKLVMMKKQGYLNEREFTIAKTKILKNLANK
jgi:hypothetical protein